MDSPERAANPIVESATHRKWLG